MFFLTLLAQLVAAQSGDVAEKTSPTGAIIIGVLLLIVIIVVLYSRQKRKYND